MRVASLLTPILLLLPLSACTAANTSPAERDQPTLPPADPGSDNQDPCGYDDYWQIAERLGDSPKHTNALSQLLVQRCENVCPLIHGSGNPDITGIGAMTSYYIQICLVLLAGPCYITFIIFFDPSPFVEGYSVSRSRSTLIRTLEPLAESVHNSSIMLSATIMVATTVRLWNWKQTPVVEVKTLRVLLTTQAMLAAVSLQFYHVVEGFRRSRPPRRLFAVFLIFTFITLSIVVGIAELRKFSWTLSPDASAALNDVMNACAEQRGYPSTSSVRPFVHSRWIPMSDTWYIIMHFATVLPFPTAYFIAFILPTSALTTSSPNIMPLFEVIFPWTKAWPVAEPSETPSRTTVFVLNGVPTLLLCFGTPFIPLEIYQLKTYMEAATGDGYEENEWGFGQIAALMAWLPFLQDLFVFCCEYYKRVQEDAHSASQRHISPGVYNETHGDFVETGDADDLVGNRAAASTGYAPQGAGQSSNSGSQSVIHGGESFLGLAERTKSFPRNRNGTYLPKTREEP